MCCSTGQNCTRTLGLIQWVHNSVNCLQNTHNWHHVMCLCGWGVFCFKIYPRTPWNIHHLCLQQEFVYLGILALEELTQWIPIIPWPISSQIPAIDRDCYKITCDVLAIDLSLGCYKCHKHGKGHGSLWETEEFRYPGELQHHTTISFDWWISLTKDQ